MYCTYKIQCTVRTRYNAYVYNVKFTYKVLDNVTTHHIDGIKILILISELNHLLLNLANLRSSIFYTSKQCCI